ncbi:MAG: hypothetical protein Kow0056_05750 [Coriobacteriia bacterium]
MSTDISKIIARENQLDILSAAITVATLSAAGLFAYALVSRIGWLDFWLLDNQFMPVLLPGFLLAVVLYIADAHRRLRARIRKMHMELARKTEELQQSSERLRFVNEMTTTAADLRRPDVAERVLAMVTERFSADGAALCHGEDIVTFSPDPADDAEVRRVALTASVRLAAKGGMLHESGPTGTMIATPVRTRGSLRSVVVLWRRDGEFSQEDAEGLNLLSHVLELTLDNKSLVADLRAQLRGSLELLTTLIEDRMQDYAGHSSEVANLCYAVGAEMGVPATELEDLKLAGLVHDLGMLRVPEHAVRMSRVTRDVEGATLSAHTTEGAKLAKAAGLSTTVREAVVAHHERFDGSGYPRGIAGDQIPLAARIVAVCDTYDAMTRGGQGRHPLPASEAITAIRAQRGRGFDPAVVDAFEKVISEQLELAALAGLDRIPGGLSGVPQPVARSGAA